MINWKKRLEEEIVATAKHYGKYKFNVSLDSKISTILSNSRKLLKKSTPMACKKEAYSLQKMRTA